MYPSFHLPTIKSKSTSAMNTGWERIRPLKINCNFNIYIFIYMLFIYLFIFGLNIMRTISKPMKNPSNITLVPHLCEIDLSYQVWICLPFKKGSTCCEGWPHVKAIWWEAPLFLHDQHGRKFSIKRQQKKIFDQLHPLPSLPTYEPKKSSYVGKRNM